MSERRRVVIGAVSGVFLLGVLVLAVLAALTRPTLAADLGPGWVLTIEVTPFAGVMAVLVPAVALPVVLYAVAHEPQRGLVRLVGGMSAFVVAMELLVVAGDLLTLLIGWELVGAASWMLIAHEWRDPSIPRRAAHAFNATRFGDLGLFAAAGAAFAGAGALDYASLGELSGWPLQVVVGGLVLAALSKSAQGPFAPWLFSAMAGPTPVSALLHSATMVAAGAYILVRLHDVLALTSWAGPTLIAVGIATALGGGVVASVQTHAKKLLAASTSAQYGLMILAVGAGFPGAGGSHLVTHAILKSLLFLAAGIAMAATGSAVLGRHRLGSHLRTVAWLALAGSWALAAIPPVGAFWTKEQILAAAGHYAPWLAILVAVAGGLSALYATRFQHLSFGVTRGELRLLREPGRAEVASLAILAGATVCSVVLVVPGSTSVVESLLGLPLAEGKAWELVLSLLLVGAGVWGAVAADRSGRFASLGLTGPSASVAEWFGLPALTKRAVVDPSLRLASAAASFDDRVVDAGVRGAAWIGQAASRLLDRDLEQIVDGAVRALGGATLAAADRSSRFVEYLFDGIVESTATGVGVAGRDSRRLQTGLVHHYYALIAAGVVVLVVVAAVWR